MSDKHLILAAIFSGMILSLWMMWTGYTFWIDKVTIWERILARLEKRGEPIEDLIRTPEWDRRANIIGTALFGMGCVLLIFLIWSMI